VALALLLLAVVFVGEAVKAARAHARARGAPGAGPALGS